MVARVLRSRDPYQAHYTGSRAIVQSMVRLLSPQTQDVVWEPAAGGGHLIDAVLGYKPGIRVIASELDAIAAAELRRKYAGAVNVTVRNEDALLADTVDLLNPLPRIDKIIANPPYGAWQTPQRRKNLKERFNGLYVKDTYAVFMWHCLDVLKNRGELVCIVPDTFLWLHRHEALRSRLFLENRVHTIILFPSWFFPGVRFGYSGMCILAVGKETPPQEHRITLYHLLKDPSVLDHIPHSSGDLPPEACSRTSVPLASLRASAHLALHLPDPTPLKQPSKQAPRTSQTTLGEVADVVTGFYSGNDRHWLRRASDAVRNAQHFRPIDFDRVFPLSQENRPPLEGLAPPQCFVPLLRGGCGSFLEGDRVLRRLERGGRSFLQEQRPQPGEVPELAVLLPPGHRGAHGGITSAHGGTPRTSSLRPKHRGNLPWG